MEWTDLSLEVVPIGLKGRGETGMGHGQGLGGGGAID